MKTPFLGGAYELRSKPIASQTLINLYPEINQSGAGEAGALVGTPGLKLEFNVGQGGEGRGMCTAGQSGGVLYIVVGNGVYMVTSASKIANPSAPATLIGTLATDTGRVCMVANLNQILITDTTGFYVSAIGGASLTSGISNAPTGADGSPIVAYMDGYGIYDFGPYVSQEFGLTAIDDFTTINPLNVAEAEALPDALVSIATTQREVWFFGVTTTEIWTDTNATTAMPFERIPGGVLSTGCASPFSPVCANGSIIWWATDSTDRNFIARTVGYQLETISNPAIEFLLDTYQKQTDGQAANTAWAYTYSAEGHSFYVLNIPAADATWAVDLSQKPYRWHRRAYQDGNGVLHMERVAATATYGLTDSNYPILALDPSNGNVYSMDPSVYTHNGQPIYRERTWPLLPEGDLEMRNVRINRLEVEAETGVGNETGTDTNPLAWLRMSYDGGQSWGNSRYQSMGKVGVRNARMLWRRLGRGRRPVAKLSTNAEVKVSFLGANIDATPCSQ